MRNIPFPTPIMSQLANQCPYCQKSFRKPGDLSNHQEMTGHWTGPSPDPASDASMADTVSDTSMPDLPDTHYHSQGAHIPPDETNSPAGSSEKHTSPSNLSNQDHNDLPNPLVSGSAKAMPNPSIEGKWLKLIRTSYMCSIVLLQTWPHMEWPRPRRNYGHRSRKCKSMIGA